MGVLVNYLHRDPKSGKLFYRRRLPAHLCEQAGRTQVRRFLRGSSIKDAQARAGFDAAAREYDEIVRRAELKAEGRRRADAGVATEITPALTEYLVQSAKVMILEDDEWARWKLKSPERRSESVIRLRAIVQEDLAEARAARGAGDIDWIVGTWGGALRDEASQRGFFLDQTTDAFRDLCRTLNDEIIEAWEAILRRLHGDNVPTPPRPERPSATKGAARPGDLSRSFEDIAESILENPRLAIGAATKQATRTALRFLRETHGAVTPEKLGKAEVSEWLDLMAARPNRLPSPQRGLPLREIVASYAGRDVKRLSNKTLGQHLSSLGAIWGKAQSEEGMIPDSLPNPFVRRKSLKVEAPEKPTQLSKAEMSAMFSLPIFTAHERPTGGKGEASYWIPLLLLWTGARPEEVSQLLVDDIFQDPDDADGRWLLRFTDEGEHPHKGSRRLKTAASRRTIPVPQALLDLNFLAYVAHVRSSGEKALFPALRTKGERGLLFPGWGGWWNGYVQAHGVLPPGEGRRAAREFRHNWTSAARASGVPEDAREYIQGHVRRGVTNRRYGERDTLGWRIDDVKFDGVDLSQVRPWQLQS